MFSLKWIKMRQCTIGCDPHSDNIIVYLSVYYQNVGATHYIITNKIYTFHKYAVNSTQV